MITTTLILILYTTIINLIETYHPVKIIIIMTSARITILILARETSGNSWFPIIFFLIFIGGILIVFIILCALLPNEPTNKTKSRKWTLIILLATPSLIYIDTEISTQIKWFMHSNIVLKIIIILILIYLISFIYVLSKNKNTLKSNRLK